jgi:proline iminopeptidase
MKLYLLVTMFLSMTLVGCASTSARSYATNAATASVQKVDGLYVNSYGNQSDPALIFIHGGPGYDSQDFEWSTASKLASKGFFIIVYDQRGQGRSDIAKDPKDYSYQQYADDIKAIIGQYNLQKPILLGHSHGGPIALKFDQIYPGLISKIILVSAPVNFWKSLDSIRTNCIERYKAVKDTENTAKLNSAFLNLNNNPSLKDEIIATSEVFQLGSNKPCDLYTPAKPTLDAINLRKEIKAKHISIVQENLFYPMANFIVNEQYIHVDQTEWVKQHGEYIFGIYGSDDGLFTSTSLREIQSDLVSNKNPNRFQLIDGASHAVYIDKQDEFLSAIMRVL